MRMKRRFGHIIPAGVSFRFLLVLTCTAILSTPWLSTANAGSSSQEKTPAQLEELYAKEANPKNRVKIAMDLADARLKEMAMAFDEGDPAKESAAADTYLSALDRLEKALAGNGRGGVAKDAEIRLRHEVQSLGTLRLTLSATEQTPVDKPLQRASRLHEDVLNRIMKK